MLLWGFAEELDEWGLITDFTALGHLALHQLGTML